MSNTKTKQHVLEMDYLGSLLDASGNNDQTESVDLRLPFMCQLIKVAGIKLALPLSSFIRILQSAEIPESVKSNGDFLLEKMQIDGHQISIVDLAHIILPAGKLKQLIKSRKNKWGSIIIMQNVKFALACDEVLDTVMLSPEEVCCRSLSSQRYWLAGTIKSGGYALLDIDELLGDL